MMLAFFQEYEIRESKLLYRNRIKKILGSSPAEYDLNKPFFFSDQYEFSPVASSSLILTLLGFVPFKTYNVLFEGQQLPAIPVLGSAVKTLLPELVKFPGYKAKPPER